jgi:hypothetical protein
MALHTGSDLVVTGKPGSVPIMGTFAVNLPLVTSTTPFYSTVVTVTGVTPDHAIVVQDNGVVSGASANSTGSSARILFSVLPQQGAITMTFVNQGATVNATDKVFSYIAALK